MHEGSERGRQRMNRILISSLGKLVPQIDFDQDGNMTTEKPGDYRLTQYKFPDSKGMFETSLVTEALINYEKPDSLLLFGTAGSSWLELYWKYASLLEKDGGLSEEEKMQYTKKMFGEMGELDCKSSLSELDRIDFEPLCQVLQKYFGLKEVKIVPILYGTESQQILDNFERMYMIEELLKEGQNEIWLDITHAFRSMPFYEFMFINYLIRLTRYQVRLSNVYYGMLEAISDLGYAPVVNLNVLTELMDWINGISELNHYGSVEQISKKLKEPAELSQWMEVFEYATNTNDFHMLDVSLKKLMRFDLGGMASGNSPERKFISTWQKDLCQQFPEEDDKLKVAKLQFAMGKWYLQQNRHGSCIILLQETVRTLLSSIRLELCKPGTKTISDEAFRKTSIEYLQNLSAGREKEGDREPEEYREYQTLCELYEKGKKFRDACAHNLFQIEMLDREEDGVEGFQKEINVQKGFIKEYAAYLEKLMQNTDWHKQYADDVKSGLAKVDQKKFEKLLILGNRGEKCENWNSARGTCLLERDPSEHNICYARKKICKEYMRMDQTKKEMEEFGERLLEYLEETVENKETWAIVFKSTDYIKQTCLMELVENRGFVVKLYGRAGENVKIRKWREAE